MRGRHRRISVVDCVITRRTSASSSPPASSFIVRTLSSSADPQAPVTAPGPSVRIAIATKPLKHASSSLSDIFAFADSGRISSLVCSRVNAMGTFRAEHAVLGFIFLASRFCQITKIRDSLAASHSDLMPVLESGSAPAIALIPGLRRRSSELLKK